MPVRDPQPTDTGFELTMLDAGDVGKFVGVATAGRWTSSSRFALRDVAVARASSRRAGRASADRRTVMTSAARRPAPRRSGRLGRGISRRPRVAPTIETAIASFACANAQRRA
jgi:hypothetical protein